MQQITRYTVKKKTKLNLIVTALPLVTTAPSLSLLSRESEASITLCRQYKGLLF